MALLGTPVGTEDEMSTTIKITRNVPVSVVGEGDHVEGVTITAELALVIGEPGHYMIIEGRHDDLRRLANTMRIHLGGVAL